VLRAEQPDWLLVQGDTTSAAAAALAAFYARSRVAHVKSGPADARSVAALPGGDQRRVVSAIAELHVGTDL